MLDPKDIFYLVAGAAFLGLTVLPLFCGLRLVSVPTLYVAGGAALALSPVALPGIDPRAGGLARTAVEHATELIVIVALAGAGLAVDRPAGLRNWSHTWMLLGVAMPLTMLGVAWAGSALAGLPLAASVLLAASLAPTDPVLARSVQVGAPTEGEEDDVRIALTTEAGLNDGLAFPFVHLAIGLAGLAAAPAEGPGWLLSWVGFDLVYRVAAALAMGWLGGRLVSRLIFSPWGDARQGGGNAGLILMGATFLVYGATEAVGGYGFLAVFIGARAGRAYARGTDDDGYARKPHLFSDQIEKILLALLLLWLGALAASGILAGWTWGELLTAAAVIGVIRPLAGAVALAPTSGSLLERGAIAGFGIRGLGTFFYLAYAQGHASFEAMPAVWRVAVLTVLLSILIHGTLAPGIMRRVSERFAGARVQPGQ